MARNEIKDQNEKHTVNHAKAWEFGVPFMENFIPASMVWDVITTKHD